jgi:hypothetical protein
VDTGRLTELRRWATRLQEASSSEEMRAAGKAILMLADEVEQLTLRLRAEREATQAREEASSAAEPLDPETAGWDDTEREQGVRARLRRTFGMGPVERDDEEDDTY